MRNKFLFVLAATVVASAVATNAVAAIAALPAKSTPAPATSMPTSVVPTSSTAVVAPNAGSTLSVTSKTVFEDLSKFSVSYLAENSVDANAANRNNYDGFSSTQHVGLAYDLGDDKRVQYRQYFHYNLTDAARADEWGLGDHVIQYTDAKAFKIADADILFYARLYLPGAEWTREVGKYELRLFESAKQNITNKMSLEYSLGTRLYTYSGNYDGQVGLRMLPAVQFDYKANKVVTPYASAYIDRRWYNTGEGPSLFGPSAGKISNPANNAESFYTDVGAALAVNDNIEVNMYVETGKDMKSNVDYKPFHQDFSTYELVLSVSM